MRATPAGSSASQPVNPAPPTVAAPTRVPRMTSLNARAGVGLGLLPAVAVDDDLDRHADQVVVDLHVVVGAHRVVLVEGPVEAAGAGVAVDGRVLRHEVVAALGVVVVLAGLTDEDVVARRGLGGIVEERRAVVALQEVLPGAALDPVVATVAEHGVGALTGDDEVVAGTGERLVVVGAAVDEVLAVVAHGMSSPGTAVDGVVARAALGHVGAVEVGDDVVAVAAERDVVAAVALDDVVAGATPEGVVVVAAQDPVGAGGAVVHGLTVDAGRVDGVVAAGTGSCRRAERSSSWFSSQSVVDGSSLTGRRRSGCEAGRRCRSGWPSWNLQSAVANASAFSVLVPSVLRWIISENELPSSWVRRFMPGVRFR